MFSKLHRLKKHHHSLRQHCLYHLPNETGDLDLHGLSCLSACVIRFDSFETQRETQQKRMRKFKRSLFISFAHCICHSFLFTFITHWHTFKKVNYPINLPFILFQAIIRAKANRDHSETVRGDDLNLSDEPADIAMESDEESISAPPVRGRGRSFRGGRDQSTSKRGRGRGIYINIFAETETISLITI